IGARRNRRGRALDVESAAANAAAPASVKQQIAARFILKAQLRGQAAPAFYAGHPGELARKIEFARARIEIAQPRCPESRDVGLLSLPRVAHAADKAETRPDVVAQLRKGAPAILADPAAEGAIDGAAGQHAPLDIEIVLAEIIEPEGCLDRTERSRIAEFFAELMLPQVDEGMKPQGGQAVYIDRPALIQPSVTGDVRNDPVAERHVDVGLRRQRVPVDIEIARVVDVDLESRLEGRVLRHRPVTPAAAMLIDQGRLDIGRDIP